MIHNFQELSTELGSKDKQLAALIDSANANFEAIANQERSLREAVRLLPDTLAETRDTLRTVDVGGEQPRPRAAEAAPGRARSRPRPAPGAAVRARRRRPIIRDELRPFARDVRPAVRDSRAAAEDLEVAVPRLTRTFKVVNSLVNTLAYNPPGSRRATCSGPPGSTTRAPRSSASRMLTAPLGAGS